MSKPATAIECTELRLSQPAFSPVLRLFVALDVENMANATRRTVGPAALVPFRPLLDALVQELTPAAKNARAYLGPGASALIKPLREAGFRPVVATRRGDDETLLIQD